MTGFAILLALAQGQAEVEALVRAHAKLETFQVEYDAVVPVDSEVSAPRGVATIDRPRRRAHLQFAFTAKDVARRQDVLIEHDLVRTWGTEGTALRFDLRAASAPFLRESGEAEAALRALLPPAVALGGAEIPVVPSLHVDVVPEGESAALRIWIGFRSPSGAPLWPRDLRNAVVSVDGPDAVFRHPDSRKICRIDRATGLVRSIRFETADGRTLQVELRKSTIPAEFPVLDLPAKFQDRPPAVQLLQPYLDGRTRILADLLPAVRGLWPTLAEGGSAARFPSLLRRWCVAYADALRTQRIRTWMADYLRDLLAKDAAAIPAAREPELAALFHNRMLGVVEQERAALLPGLQQLLLDLKPDGEPVAGFDAAFLEATSPEGVLDALPPWTGERVRELLSEELKRAKPE